MTIELIPVIEIGYANQLVQVPDKYPYWDYPELWDEFHNQCYKRAGFRDKFTPYLTGSSFYRLPDITDDNLKKLTIDHTQELKKQSCSFFGGYVLRINNQDIVFPQCCGVLADINFWTRISKGQESYYEGHPVPKITFNANSIRFDLTTNEFDEIFQPPPPVPVFQVDKAELRMAIEKTKQELMVFTERLEQINSNEKLDIAKIGEVLVWYDGNY